MDMYGFLVVVISSTVYAEWRIKLHDEFQVSIFQNIPFQLLYADSSEWRANNLTWFVGADSCNADNEQRFVATVQCSQPGAYLFGLINHENREEIKEHKIVVVKPNFYCFYWKFTEFASNERTKKLTVAIDVFNKPDLENSRYLGKTYNALGGVPLVYVEKSKVFVNTTFDVIHGNWVFEISLELPSTSYVLTVESLLKKPVGDCFIRQSKYRIFLPNYDMALMHGKQLIDAVADVNDRVIRDPYSSHTYILIRNKTLVFSPKDFLNKENAQLGNLSQMNIDEIWLLKQHIGVLSNGNIYLFEGSGPSLIHLSSVNNTWKRVYTCTVSSESTLDKHRNGETRDDYCNFFLLLNDTNRPGQFFMYMLETRELQSLRIPYCTDNSSCNIVHVEVAINIDLIRLFYRKCVLHCQLYFVDYYVSLDFFYQVLSVNSKNERNNCIRIFDIFETYVSFSNFSFWPEDSLDMLLFSELGIYQMIDHRITCRYLFKEIDGFISQTSMLKDSVIVLMSTGYAFYLQYGALEVQKIAIETNIKGQYSIEMYKGDSSRMKIYLGPDLFIFPVDSTYIVAVRLNSSTSDVVEDTIPIPVVLDANFHGVLKCSVRRHLKIRYHMDIYDRISVSVELYGNSSFEQDVQAIYSSAYGLEISSTTAKVTINNIRATYKNYTIFLNRSGSLPMRKYPRLSSVTFAPINYHGYYGQQAFLPETMFISFHCPPQRYLKLETQMFDVCKDSVNASDALSIDNVLPSNILRESISCISTTVANQISVTLSIFDGAQRSMIVAQDELFDLEIIAGVKNGAFITVVDALCNMNIKKAHLFIVSTDYEKVEISKIEEKRNVSFVRAGTYVVRAILVHPHSLCDFDALLFVTVNDIPKDYRTVYIVASISVACVLSFIFLFSTFIYFKNEMENDYIMEAENQKRQQELRYLTSIHHFQEPLETNTNSTTSGVANRRSLNNRIRSSILPSNDIFLLERNSMDTVVEERTEANSSISVLSNAS